MTRPDGALRALVICDQCPHTGDPAAAPSAWRPFTEAENGVEWRGIWLRRVFPPLRLVSAPGTAEARLEDARWWLRSVVDPPLLPKVASVRYTAPPRSAWEHAWGAWAWALRGGRMMDLAAAWRPDVVHGHWAVPSGDVAVRLAASLGVPSVVSVHGSDLAVTAEATTAGRAAVSRILERADIVIANSGATEDEIQRLTGGAAHVTTLWQGGDSCARESSVHTPLRIVTVGHLYRHKGTAEAARALAACRSAGLEFRWTIVGAGTAEDTARLDALIREAGLQACTTRIQSLPNADLLELLGDSDVLLHLPSREAYGIVVAEALGAGLAVVGSRSAGSVLDFVANGAPVVDVSPGDTQAAAAAVLALCGDPGRLRVAKRASAEWAKAHLGWGRYVAELTAVYRRAVRDPEELAYSRADGG